MTCHNRRGCRSLLLATASLAVAWVGLAPVRASEPDQVVITGPARLQSGAYAFFQVAGLDSQDPARSIVAMVGVDADGKPINEGITCIPFAGWGGGHVLFVAAAQPGKYTITVTVNGWRASLERAVADAGGAGISAELLQQLRDVAAAAAGAYPYRSGSATLEVVGANPPPPPPPPPPEVGKRWILLFYESAQSTPDLALQILQLRAAKYLSEKGHQFRAVDKDLPAAQSWLQVLKPGSLPCLAIAELTAGDGTGRVLFAGALPQSFDTTIALLKQHGG